MPRGQKQNEIQRRLAEGSLTTRQLITMNEAQRNSVFACLKPDEARKMRAAIEAIIQWEKP